MRVLKGLCVFALAISLTGLVYAETQAVKISGDLTIRSFMRGDYDLDSAHNETLTANRADNADTWRTFFGTTTEVQIDADLTDNVAGVVRLYNQRDWGVRAKSVTSATPMSTSLYTANDNEFDVGVDLAYVELKEFLYSPLTLKIGRQDIWFGKGFVVGANQRDPQGTLEATEYTSVNSFDAIRATLDYDPWTIDLVAAKIWENARGSDDDEDLYGINVGYIFDVFNAEAEGYWFYKDDSSMESWNVKDGNDIHTLGIRGSMDPIENWTIATECALQYGQYVGSRNQLEKRDRSAWAVDASVECRYFQDMFEWKPKVGVEYIYYSGHQNLENENPMSTGMYTGWDSMYRGKFDSAIREFMGSYYLTMQDQNNMRTDCLPTYPDASTSNQHQLIVAGSIEPTDSLTVDMRYVHFWQQYKSYHFERATGIRVADDKYLGSEIDVELTWDYTEDVSFGLLAAWYLPGTHYFEGAQDIATDVVGSVKLSF